MTTTATTPAPTSTGTAPAAPARPGRIIPVGRRLAVVGLVGGAVLNTTEAVLGQFLPARPETVLESLRLVGEHPVLFGTRAVLGTLAVPLMAVGFLAAARLLLTRAPRTAVAAGALLLAGMWGFLGMHVVMLLELPASASRDLPAAAAVLEQVQSSPVLGALFLVPFLAGCVLGMLVLTAGMLRTGGVPRWIPATWLVFLVVDFTVGAVGPVDPHWLFLAGALGLAHHVLRAGDAAWRTA
ncbi:hypothetical protein NUM3379_26080 [Kineococcus sp. NUM-3379]